MTWSAPGIIFGLLVFYALGAGGTFIVNMKMGNITPPLAIMRALAWPYWWITGKPDGSSLGPD